MNPLLLLGVTVAFVFLNVMGFTELVYPLHLFITYVHEWGHAFAAIMTGGHVQSMAVNPDGSGVTYTSGGSLAIIASSGYLGTLFVGCLSLQAMRLGLKGSLILFFYAAIVLVNAFYAGVFSFTTAWGIVIAGALLGFAVTPLAPIVAAFMALQLMLGAFYDMNTLLSLSLGTNVYTDAVLMRQATGIPATFWSLLWMSISAVTAWKMFKSFIPQIRSGTTR